MDLKKIIQCFKTGKGLYEGFDSPDVINFNGQDSKIVPLSALNAIKHHCEWIPCKYNIHKFR